MSRAVEQAGEVWKGVMINRKKSGELYHEEMTIATVADYKRS